MLRTMGRWLLVAFALPAACIGPSQAAEAPQPVVVFAAASLKNALDDAKSTWEKRSGRQVVVDYAGSNALARQIEQGAPADLFISADREWMQYLADKGLVRTETRRELLGNQLVLIAPKASTVTLRIAPGFGLAAALGNGRLAVCTPAVPCGKYAIASLQALGVWDRVQGHLAQAENVRAALSLVSLGEAPLGIVYASDANADPGARVVDTFPEATHPPITYPIALLKRAANPHAAALLQFLESAEARPCFEKQGFSWLLN